MADPQQGMRRRYVRWNEQDAVPPPQLSSNADQEARASLTRFSAEPDVLRGLYNRLTGDDAAAEAAYGRALQTQQRAAEQDSNVSTQWRDWGSVGDVAAGVRKVLTGSAPDMVLALGAGGVGRGLARRTVGNIERRAAVQQIEQRLANEGIDSLVGRKVAENAARKPVAAAASPQVAQAQFQDAIDRTGADLVRRAPGAQGRIDAAGRAGFAGGLTAGSFPGVAAQNAQELSEADREGTWRMMPYMGAQAGLEAVMEGRLAGRALGNPYVKEALQEGLGATRGALSKLPGRIAKETVQNAATEAGTEGMQALLQTAGQRAGRGEDPLAFTDGDLAGALDQAIVGGLAGGAMGGSVEVVNASVPAAVDAVGRAVRAGADAGRWAWDKTGGVRQALRERIRAAAEKRRSPLDAMDGGADPGAQDAPADLGARAGAAAKQAFDTAGTLFDKAKQGLTSAAQRFRGTQDDLTQADELDAQANGAMDWLQANVFEQQGQPPAARHPYTSKATSPLQAWALAKMNPAFLDTLPETEALRLGRAIEKYARNSDLTGAESRLLREAIAVPDSGLSRDMLNATALVAERVMQPQSKAFKDAEGNAPRLAQPRGSADDMVALTQDPGGADVVGMDVAGVDSQDSAAALSRDWNSGFSEQAASDGVAPIDQLHSIERSLDELRRGRPDLLKEQYAAWKQREPQPPKDPRLAPLLAERRKRWLAERPQFESEEQALTAQAAAIRERARASLENGVVFTRNDASDASRAFWARKTAEHWAVPLKDPKEVVLKDGKRTIKQPQVVDLKVVVGRALAALNAEGTPHENIPLEAALARGLSDLATLGYRINFHKMPTGELRAGGQTLKVTPKLIRKIVRHVDRRPYGPWPERKGSKPKRSESEERALNNEYGRQDDASMYESEPTDENAFLKQEYAQGARKPPPGSRAPDGSFVPSLEVVSDVSIKSPFEKHIADWRKERRIAQQRGAPPAVLRNINIKHGQKIGAALLAQEASNGQINPKRYDAEMRRLNAPNGTQALKVLTRALRGDFDNISARHPKSDLAERARGDAADPSGLRVIDKPEPRQFVKRTAQQAERRAAADARADAAARKAGREPAPSSVPAGTQQTGMILRAGREPVGKPREAHKDVIDVQQGTKRDALGRVYPGATVAAAPLAPQPKAVETTTRGPKEAPKRAEPEVFYRGKPVTQSPEAPSGAIPKDVREAVAAAAKRVKPARASNRNGEYVDPPIPKREDVMARIAALPDTVERVVDGTRVLYVKDADATKYIAGTRNGVVYVNMGKLRADGLIKYLTEGPSAAQKQAVFDALGITAQSLDAVLGNDKRRAAFLRDHELSHIRNGDEAIYPRDSDGKPDLMHPDAIAIESRATRDALSNSELAALGVGKASTEKRQAPKTSQGKVVNKLNRAAPAAPARVILPRTSPYTAKDQAKSDRANKFIGRGAPGSSTAAYAKAWGDRANMGEYSPKDTVFISVNGNRPGALPPPWSEIKKAMSAGATLITDVPADRNRSFNSGERAVAAFLADNGYFEESPGTWVRERFVEDAAQNGATAPEARLQEPEPGQPGSREAPHIIPMYYKIGNVLRLRKELRDSYSSSDSIAALIERGDRTGTTRQPPRGVLPGHYITFPGVKGLYRVTGFEKIDLLSDAGREAWSKREGWAPEAADTFGPQVQHGKIQMQFERVDTSQPSQRKHPTEEQEGAPQQATKDVVQNDELTDELTPEQSDAIDAGAKSASSDGRHDLKAERSMLNTILGMLGITEQIGALRTLEDADERGNNGGSYARRSRTVSINPNLHGAERVEVLMHELGHHIIWNEIAKYVDGGFDALRGMTLAESIDVLAKGNPKLYAALRKDFDQWNTTGRPSQSPTHRYLRKLTNGLTRTFKDDHHAFHEWFADNIARSLVGKRPVVGVVGKFFAKIATQLRKAWSVISANPALKPAPSVDAWVKQMLNANVAAVKEVTGQAAPQAKAEATVRGAVAAQAAKAGPVKYTMENLGDLVALIETVLPVESRQLLDRVFARVDVMNRLLAAYSGRADLDAMFGDPKKPGSGEAFVKRMLDHPSQGASARVAFGYLAWQDGLLKTGPQGQNALLGLSDSVLRLFGAAGDGALAQRTLYDIQTGAVQRFKDAGKIYSARDLAARNGNNFQRALNWVNRMVESSPASNALAAFWTGNNTRMRESGIPALRTLATMLDRPQGSIGESNPGLITNIRVQTARWNRQMREALEPLTDRQRLRVLRALQRRAKAGDKAYDSLPEAARAAVGTIRGMFRDAYRYQREAGYTEDDLGHIRDYMPVIMDVRNENARAKLTALYSKPEYARDVAIAAGFVKPDEKGMYDGAEIKAVTEDPLQMAKAVEYLVRAAANDGQTPPPAGAAGRFHFRHQNTQLSAFIYRHGNPDDIKTLASLQTRDPGEVFARYFAPMVRWAEMARMFGEPEQVRTKNGDPVVDPTTGREVWHMNPRAKLDRLLDQVKKQGGTDDDVAFADNAVRAALGVYGADGSPTIAAVSPWAAEKLKGRKAQAVIEGVQAYQNARLLPLALLSNLVDPVGIAVRTGGEFNDAWAGFKEGMGFVRAALSKDPQAAKRMLKELEDIDVSEDFLPALAANPVFEGGRTGKARAVNDFVFKWNGVQTWVTATRVMAMYAGHKFLLRHAQLPNEHSARYLQELGLQPTDIVEDPNNPGKVEINDKTRAALRQFVDEAILRPNSQQAPLWMSDPYMGIVAQYKLFAYAIWEQIGGRIGREITQGNMRVVVAALMYLPVSVMAELVREMIQTAGEGDDRRKDWGVLEYTKLAADRSGLLGPQYQIMGDIKGDIERSRLPGTSQLGPAVNQGRNVLDALQGRRDPGKEFESALPGSPLYRKWNDDMGEGASDAAAAA